MWWYPWVVTISENKASIPKLKGTFKYFWPFKFLPWSCTAKNCLQFRSLKLSYESIIYNFLEERYKAKVSEIKTKRSWYFSRATTLKVVCWNHTQKKLIFIQFFCFSVLHVFLYKKPVCKKLEPRKNYETTLELT